MQDKKRKAKIVKISWDCDDKKCKTVNFREVPENIVLNDDVCDYCHKRIHEPNLRRIEE